jgi:transcriptional regulator with XRE-family HTH domain
MPRTIDPAWKLFGAKIKRLRQLADLSRAQLASQIIVGGKAMSPNYLRNIELGKAFPSQETLNNILGITGQDIETLRSMLEPQAQHLLEPALPSSLPLIASRSRQRSAPGWVNPMNTLSAQIPSSDFTAQSLSAENLSRERSFGAEMRSAFFSTPEMAPEALSAHEAQVQEPVAPSTEQAGQELRRIYAQLDNENRLLLLARARNLLKGLHD